MSKRVFEIPTMAVFNADLFSIDFRISNESSVLFLQKMYLQTHTDKFVYNFIWGCNP